MKHRTVEYEDVQMQISDICVQYGYKNCHLCPLASARLIERDLDNESQHDFTQRWEQGMADEFVRKFPNLV